MVRTDVDWVSKYKVKQSPEKQDGTDDEDEWSSEEDTLMIAYFYRNARGS
jgi:hypothetical protein